MFKNNRLLPTMSEKNRHTKLSFYNNLNVYNVIRRDNIIPGLKKIAQEKKSKKKLTLPPWTGKQI